MRRKLTVSGIACALLIALDRLTKAWAVRTLPGDPLEIIPGWLSLRYAENTGAAFGMLSGMRLLNALLTLALLVCLAVFVWRLRREKGMLASGAVVMAGGLSHLYDRLLGKNIVDFISLDIINFPIFNVADICICAGVCLLAIAYVRYENNTRSKQA